ncbi:hypothetical protein ACIBF1_24200 [Spirillospora sp. NPDC050679]
MGDRKRRAALPAVAMGLGAALGSAALQPVPAAADPNPRRVPNVPFVDRLGCGKDLRTLFTYDGVKGSGTSGKTRLPAGDDGYPDATLTGQNTDASAWDTVDYPAGFNGGLNSHWQGEALEPYNKNDPMTAVYDLGYAQRLFFSVTDLDAYEHIQIVGYRDGKPVTPRGIPRGGDNPKVSTDGDALDIRDTTGVVDPGADDFIPLDVVDVVFDEPVDQVRIVVDGHALGSAAITRFFGCRDTNIDKRAGTPKRVSTGKNRVTYAIPYTVTVGNPYGNMPARPRVTDDVARRFPKGSVVSVVPGKVTGPRPACTPNKGFFSRKGGELLPGAGFLAGGQKCTVHYTVKVSYPRGVNPPPSKNTATLYENGKTAVVDRDTAVVDVGAVPVQPPAACRCRPGTTA